MTTEPRLLFLTHTSCLGGAELCLLDLMTAWPNNAVCSTEEGPLLERCEASGASIVRLGAKHSLKVTRDAGLLSGVFASGRLLKLAYALSKETKKFDLVYANSLKALLIAASSCVFRRRRIIFHLHDILTLEHFSKTNIRLVVITANRAASLVIANSKATRDAFVQAGGREDLVEVVHVGIDSTAFIEAGQKAQQDQSQLGQVTRPRVVGVFGRLSPWKGQHVLIEALPYLPQDVVVRVVGGALFGEEDYEAELKAKVDQMGLVSRVEFMGFRTDIPKLMAECDIVAHTSISPEPFGRVIPEAMLTGVAVVASNSGGPQELLEDGVTGRLVEPGDSAVLGQVLNELFDDSSRSEMMAQAGHVAAKDRWALEAVLPQWQRLVRKVAASISDK